MEKEAIAENSKNVFPDDGSLGEARGLIKEGEKLANKTMESAGL